MTLTEFISWRGPQSVQASSPKCRSANSAILNGEPGGTWRESSGSVLRGICRRRLDWKSYEWTVRMNRESRMGSSAVKRRRMVGCALVRDGKMFCSKLKLCFECGLRTVMNLKSHICPSKNNHIFI